ncbi:hypothetical protein C0991_007581 [Blastosporella zonata]|nr:hypothetical protein C0991_007581 [Blastosporella zonata]
MRSSFQDAQNEYNRPASPPISSHHASSPPARLPDEYRRLGPFGYYQPLSTSEPIVHVDTSATAHLSPLPASPALLDDIDTPAVPGSWYGAALSDILNSPPDERPASDESAHENMARSHDESDVVHFSPQNEALLNWPPSPGPGMPQVVFPSSNHTLAELLNGYHSMSNLTLEDPKVQEEEPSPTTVVPLSAGYVADITAPDGQIFAPSVTFIKVWRMVNNGTQDWPVNTEVVFVGGAQLASGNPPPHIQPMCTVGPLKPGEEKNIWTPELKAPDAPGRYTSYWRLRDDKGQLFGDSIWVEIEVINPAYSNPDETISSSSMIIMPDPPSPASLATDDRAILRSPANDTEENSDDYFSDSSSVSLVSMPSSEDEADATLWTESRLQTGFSSAGNRAQATADYVAEHGSQAMDYVLLYDDNTSEEE